MVRFTVSRKNLIPKIATTTVVIIAAFCAHLLYRRYQSSPWTRDAQVRADVVKITPRVSGYLVEIAVSDNQAVSQGDLLFRIDPTQYQLAVDQAQVQLIQARQSVEQFEAAVRAAEAVVKQREAALTSAKSQINAAVAGVESAGATLVQAAAGVTSAKAKIAQAQAQLAEAERQAARAQTLADKKAGSVQTAQAKAASQQSYEAELDSVKAGLTQAEAAVAHAKAAKHKAQADQRIAENGLIEAQAALLTAQADLEQAKANLGEPGDANYRIQNAKVQLEQAQLNLNWTSVYAPSDGYISNMNLLGSTFVSAGTPFALFVDASSFRVEAYFQETKLKHIQPGGRAVITLMSRHDQQLDAEIESIGYAINPPNLASTDGPGNLVPTIQPTFEWIRLAQRVPVRIRFKEIPQDLHLVSGLTASVAICNE